MHDEKNTAFWRVHKTLTFPKITLQWNIGLIGTTKDNKSNAGGWDCNRKITPAEFKLLKTGRKKVFNFLVAFFCKYCHYWHCHKSWQLQKNSALSKTKKQHKNTWGHFLFLSKKRRNTVVLFVLFFLFVFIWFAIKSQDSKYYYYHCNYYYYDFYHYCYSHW